MSHSHSHAFPAAPGRLALPGRVQGLAAAAVLDPEEIRGMLTRQMTHPVRWVETIQAMVRDGITTFYEVGPGKVLAGLVKRIERDAEVISCASLADIEAVRA